MMEVVVLELVVAGSHWRVAAAVAAAVAGDIPGAGDSSLVYRLWSRQRESELSPSLRRGCEEAFAAAAAAAAIVGRHSWDAGLLMVQ
jgi:hypothetical protein